MIDIIFLLGLLPILDAECGFRIPGGQLIIYHITFANELYLNKLFKGFNYNYHKFFLKKKILY